MRGQCSFNYEAIKSLDVIFDRGHLTIITIAASFLLFNCFQQEGPLFLQKEPPSTLVTQLLQTTMDPLHYIFWVVWDNRSVSR